MLARKRLKEFVRGRKIWFVAIGIILLGSISVLLIVSRASGSNSALTKSNTESSTDKEDTTTETENTVDNKPGSSNATEPSSPSTRTPNSDSSNSDSSQDIPVSSGSIAPNAPQASVPQTPMCNEGLRASYSDYYNSMVNSENNRLSNQINQINQSWQNRGMYYSGGREAEISAAQSASNQKIQSLTNDYQNKLSSINC